MKVQRTQTHPPACGGTSSVSFYKLTAFLNSQPANTVATPYFINISVNISVNIFSGIREALSAAPDKYVYVTFYGSFLGVLYNCTNLTGITIPNIRKTARFT